MKGKNRGRSRACQERTSRKTGPGSKTLRREKKASLLGAGTGTSVAGHVDRHLQIDGNTEFAVGENVDANDFCEIIRAHGIVWRIRKGDEDAHSLVVSRALGD